MPFVLVVIGNIFLQSLTLMVSTNNSLIMISLRRSITALKYGLDWSKEE